MISNVERAHDDFEQEVAQRYKQQGYKVIVEPQKSELPFDLGTYKPDLIVMKSPDEGYIIEAKSAVSQTPIDRYRDISEIVSGHPGWSFLLVTGEDVPLSGQDIDSEGLLTWGQMLERQSQAERLISLGEVDAAYLLLWGIFEAALRRRAKQAAIPIERLQTSALIKHLYSQGVLPLEQFDQAMELDTVRNRIAHGYQAPEPQKAARQLQKLVQDVLSSWANTMEATN